MKAPSLDISLPCFTLTLLALILFACDPHFHHALAAILCACILASVVLDPKEDAFDPGESADLSVPTNMRDCGDVGKNENKRVRPVRVVVIGANALGRRLAKNLEADGGYNVIGFIDDVPDVPGREKGGIIGGRDAVMSIIQQHGIEEVFVAYAPSWQQELADRLSIENPNIGVRIVPTSYESAMCLPSVESYGDIAVMRLGLKTGRWSEIIKRLFDIVIATISLAFSLPIAVFTAVLIKVTSSGPVLFAQERTGRFGKSFRLYKFRTMTLNAESATGPVLSSGKNDPRLTPMGRWLRMVRIDEIPQLLNVLRGDMSMVGPRPERPCFTDHYEKCIPHYARRHGVRPGITGLAQVCGGYHTDARDKLRFDLIYNSHQSIWLDVNLLFRTVLVVLMPRCQNFESSDVTNEI